MPTIAELEAEISRLRRMLARAGIVDAERAIPRAYRPHQLDLILRRDLRLRCDDGERREQRLAGRS